MPLAPELPELLGYRIKNVLLGRPLVNEELATERLGSFMALGVLSPDAISSSAYGTEEMLVELVKYRLPRSIVDGIGSLRNRSLSAASQIA